MNLNRLFLEYCTKEKLEINNDQIDIIKLLQKFNDQNFKNSFFLNLLSRKNEKIGFYLHGDVGVGKTMLLNFFYDNFNHNKKRLHFNEFIISFHDFVFNNKKDDKKSIIDKFVSKIKKKYRLIYFDEFQVTNIVDAMILGKLFKKIFDANIKVIFSSNIKIHDLYKDGLQREQFLPFIKILKLKCYEIELIIKEDYRKSKKNKNKYYFYPLNDKTNFKINKLFRKLTKGRTRKEKIVSIKGRKFNIKKYYQGIARFNFKDLCNKNIGAEDYLKIAKVCDFLIIEKLPDFNNNNLNQQQRFITLIDIIYEKKIFLAISSESSLQEITSAKSLMKPFKRTTSRLYELTSIKNDYL
jgi:cell division protein ZapE